MSAEPNGSMPSLMLIEHEGEPRVLDLQLAEALGFATPRMIRQLIERNLDELKRYGFCCTVQQNHRGGRGRPSTEYLLNEQQAYLIAVRAQTPRAADVREMLIRVFMAWRHRHDHAGVDDELPPLPNPTVGIEDLHRSDRRIAEYAQKLHRRQIARLAAMQASLAETLARIEKNAATGRQIAAIVNNTLLRLEPPPARQNPPPQDDAMVAAREVALMVLHQEDAIHPKLCTQLSKELDRHGRSLCWPQGRVRGVPEKKSPRTFPAQGVTDWLTGPPGGLDWIKRENTKLYRETPQTAGNVLHFPRPDEGSDQ